MSRFSEVVAADGSVDRRISDSPALGSATAGLLTSAQRKPEGGQRERGERRTA
jgi:hypothetical protein